MLQCFWCIIFWELSLHIQLGVSEEPPVLNPMFVPPNLAIGDNIELSCIVKRGSYPVQLESFLIAEKTHINHSFTTLIVAILTVIARVCVAEEPVLNPLLIPPNLSLGDNIELMCTLKRGNLPLTFRWLYNGIDITEKMKKKIGMNQMSTYLSIGKLQASDIGNYTCVVNNKVGEDRVNVQVLIDAINPDTSLITVIEMIYKRYVDFSIVLIFIAVYLRKVCCDGEMPVLNPMFIPPNLAVGDMTELTFEANDAPVLNPLLIPPNLALGDITEIACSIKRGSTPVAFNGFRTT
ncbi:hypothetical protein HNY73_022245 [Argiope bruennichi]|uniref:Ig-like domain-containing protein n=1 Tax=Argiope bruennichi TaxID=94029 RepID=A0A8T0E2K5_ARGBR|nr:hypothetical protein HNY73_022245 [Argiope bruennichi]